MESYSFVEKTVHSGNLTQQWKMDPLMMHFLLKMGVFHCHVSLPEGISIQELGLY